MELIMESDHIEDYLEKSSVIDYDHPLIAEKVSEIRGRASAVEEQAALAFNFARDGIRHSFDAKDRMVTIAASQAVAMGTGICFAKSHLLAALLRGLGIPAGFCYQRVMRQGTPESGYALHGLNAANFHGVGWVRLDPRGDRPGVHSEFHLHEERLAYTLDTSRGEHDYPYVYRRPLPSVIQAMRDSADCDTLFYRRPEAITKEEALGPDTATTGTRG